MKDLRERFAKCAIQRSEAIVPFRETAIKAPDMAPPKTKDAPRGTVHGDLFSGLVTYTIRAVPLPPKVIEFLLANTSTISNMSAHGADHDAEDAQEKRDAAEGTQESQTRNLTTEQFWKELEVLFASSGPEWAGAADRIWSFGPKRMGANILLDPPGRSSVR